MHDGQPLWPWYLLGGVGIVILVTFFVQGLLAMWSGVFLIGVASMVVSSSGWFVYKFAESRATGGRS
jgi:hypothetical protein